MRHAKKSAAIGLLLIIVFASCSKAEEIKGDSLHGQKLYGSCTGCHSIDENDIGPLHRGVVGRRAGSIASYTYSDALRKSRIVWTKENRDQRLLNPQALVAGTKMFFSLSTPKDRADIIAYLETQK